MSLPSGSSLGPYQVLSPLGAGGMGEVYRARDTRLGRDVAIKVLPTDVAGDPERRARFEREARTVAALDHPNICGIHDVGEADGTHYLVMPLLDGQTLAARLAKGPLPIAQALAIAGEIADALDKAHRLGIVHRDLKPANVMLTKSGAKLLDFGLAKLRPSTGAVTMSGAKSATTTAGTAEGTILGTIHYMAPEQVEGKDADHRVDIWALGAVTYEMVTGVRPFQGDTAASVIGAILKDSPSALSARQPLTPALLDRITGRCMEKDPERRWQSVADVRELLVLASEGPEPGRAITAGTSGSRKLLTLGAVSVALAAGLVAALPSWRGNRSAVAATTLQLSVLPPADAVFSSPPSSVVAPQLTVSPDGTRLAFVAQSGGAAPMLWVRPLGADKAEVVRGTEDATYPFWSPDSRSLGFFSRGSLKTTDLTGSPPRTLAEAGLDTRGGAWGRDGVILFAPANGPLSRVSADGGPVTAATQIDVARGETSHRFPSFLPDGRRFLFATRTKDSSEDSLGLSAGSVDSSQATPVVPRTAWGGQFVEPGYILYLRAGTLLAQPFDPTRLAATGEPLTLAEDVGATTVGYPSFSASANGILVFASHISVPGQLQWFRRDGVPQELVGTPGEYLDIALSPDQKTLAFSRIDDPGLASADLWLLDLARNVPTRFTTHPLNEASALWSRDGREIVLASVGTYSLNRSVFDLGLLYVVGAAGFAMRVLGIPLIPAVMGLVLGPMAEQELRRALAIGEGNPMVLVTRPISGLLLVVAASVVVGPWVLRRWRSPRSAAR